MTERGEGAWRDERHLPLEELTEAMAVYSADGQVDDPTGGDAGAAEFDAEPEPAAEVDPDLDREDGDPDPDSEQGRRLRPSPDGRIGPV